MFCMKCGKELQDGSKFCASCGAGTSSTDSEPNSGKNKLLGFANSLGNSVGNMTGTVQGKFQSNSDTDAVNNISESTGGATGILELYRQRSLTGADVLRAYKVLIDGKEIGGIKSGETLKFPLATGNHTLQLKIDWCSSKETVITILENQATYAKCAPIGKGLLSVPSAFLNKDGYISIKVNDANT